MSYKIVIIGGGSVLWTPRLCCDMFMEPALDGSELVLVDIDAAAARLCKSYLERCLEVLKKSWRISIADEDSALKNASSVVVSISTGGFEAMDKDYTIPEKYGVFHTVGDTTGPGGIFRTIRNAPVFLALAEKMSRLCPQAMMLHVTNPLSQITRLVNATGLVKCCGLCHEGAIAMNMLREYFGFENSKDIDCNLLGVNHFTLITDLWCRGVKTPMSELRLDKYMAFIDKRQNKQQLSGSVDDLVVKNKSEVYPNYFNFLLTELTGVYPAAGAVHIAENFPRFVNDQKLIQDFYLWRKGVLPQRPQRKAKLTKRLQDKLSSGEIPEETQSRSREMLADALVGVLTNEPRRIIATLPNQGQISNLPQDVSVETWAVASAQGITPVIAGAIPLNYLGFMSSIVAEQELTVQAALQKDLSLLKQALFASPLLHNKETVNELMEEMLEAQKQWITW